MKKYLFYISIVVLVCTLLQSYVFVGKKISNTPARLYVYNDHPIMDNFLGVNATYHGFAFQPEHSSLAMTNDDRTREFRRIQNMDFKIARTWYRPNWACSTTIYDNFNWESSKMQAFYLWLDKMKQLNVKVAIQAGWWFPKDTYMGHALPDSSKDLERYSTWVVESLNQMIKVRGYTNIKYLMLFTEPLNYHSKNVPYPYYTPDYYATVCNKINEKLIKAGLRNDIKLVGPNSGSTDTAAYVGWSVNKLNKIIDIYSWHAYNGKTFTTNPPLEYDGWKKIVDVGQAKVAKTGKPFWIDEYGANMPNEKVRSNADYGNYIAQCVAAFMNGGAQTSLLWILFDQKYEGNSTNNDSFYNGVQRWGLVKYPHDTIKNSTQPYPAFYAFSMMSKYLGGRTPTKVYKTSNSDSLYIVSTQFGENRTIMVVNAAHTAQKFNVVFAKPINCNFNRHLYDPAKIKSFENIDIISTDKSFKNVASTFSDSLPARGVSIYTTMN